MRNYPDFIEAFLESVSSMGVPERYKIWSAISIVAGALERKVWLMHKDYTLYPNLFVVIVGGPGVGKSTVASRAVKILSGVPGIAFSGNKINEASFLDELTEIGEWKKFEFEGQKYSHSACFLFASEAATSFAEMYPGSSIAGTLTDLFNCGDEEGWSEKRGFTKRTKKEGRVTILNPCINMLACTTSTWLTSKMLTKEEVLGGFGARIIIVNHKGSVVRDNIWKDPTVKSHMENKELVNDLLHISKLKGPFELSASWREAYKELGDAHQKNRNETPVSDIMESVAERKMTQAAKVSMILSASRQSSLVVEADDFIKAWQLLTALEDNIADAYSGLVEDPENKVATEIFNYIQKKKLRIFTRKKMIADFKPKYSMKQITKALSDLVSYRQIEFILFDDHGRGMQEQTFKVTASEHVTEVP